MNSRAAFCGVEAHERSEKVMTDPVSRTCEPEKYLMGASAGTLLAHLTAQAWIRAGFCHADWFDTWQGRQMFVAWSAMRAWLAPLPSPFIHHQLDCLILRHRTLDRRLRALAPDFVIEVGAGLSPRGIAYAEDHPRATYLELDLREVVREKRSLLRTRHLPGNYRLGTGDLLSTDFRHCVSKRALENQNLAVITEGVMPYLERDAQRTAWRNVAALARKAADASYLLDMYPRDQLDIDPLGTELTVGALSIFTHTPIAENLFDSTDALVDELCGCGFSAVKTLPPAILTERENVQQPWVMLEAMP